MKELSGGIASGHPRRRALGKEEAPIDRPLGAVARPLRMRRDDVGQSRSSRSRASAISTRSSTSPTRSTRTTRTGCRRCAPKWSSCSRRARTRSTSTPRSSCSSPAAAARWSGRISAHYDELALAQPPEQGMGPGTGNWGLFEAEDEAVAHALIAARRAMAARAGHDPRARADQPVDLGRARPAGQRPRPSADGDDGPQQAPNTKPGSRAPATPWPSGC